MSTPIILPDGSYFHTNTKNKSFIKMYRYLVDKGIKNNKFFLKVYDKDLLNIDPLKITPENDLLLYTKIIYECTINPWYYYREIYMIPETGGAINFQLDRGSLAFLYLSHKNKKTVAEQPRQTGKTWRAVAFIDHTFNFTSSNTEFLFMNKSNSDTKKNIERFVTGERERPPQYRFRTHRDVDNKEKIGMAAKNNIIKMVPCPISADMADKAGRGLTSPIVWFDEFSFIKYIPTIFGSAAPVLSRASVAAQRNKVPYTIIATFTPNFLDSEEGKFAFDLMKNAARFTEDMYDLSDEELDEYVVENSTNDFVYLKFTWRELGYDEDWYKQQCRDLLGKQIRIKREIDLEWTFASNTSPFSEEELSAVNAYIKEPIFVKRLGHYMFNVYQPIDIRKAYVIAADTSGGLLQDSSSIVIIDPDNKAPAAIFNSNKISIPLFRNLIYEVLKKWLITGFAVIERNSFGLAIVQEFLTNPDYVDIRGRLFYTVREESTRARSSDRLPDESKSRLSSKRSRSRVYGIDTTVSTRPLLFELLFQVIRESPAEILSNELFEQIKTLEVKTNGKIEHRQGFHDDIVLAYLIGRYAMTLKTYNIFRARRLDAGKEGSGTVYTKFMAYQNNLEQLTPMTREFIRNEEERNKNKYLFENPDSQGSFLDMVLGMNRKEET